MKKWFVISLSLVILLTSPVWFFVLKNEILAYRIQRFLTSASLPDSASFISTTRRVFNSGNGDGCDYQAFAIIEYHGRAAELRSSFSQLFEHYPKSNIDDYVHEYPADSPVDWSIKVVGSATEFYMKPNIDHAPYYFVYLTEYHRAVSPDFRCW